MSWTQQCPSDYFNAPSLGEVDGMSRARDGASWFGFRGAGHQGQGKDPPSVWVSCPQVRVKRALGILADLLPEAQHKSSVL